MSSQCLGAALAAPIVEVLGVLDAQVTGRPVGDHRGPRSDGIGDEPVQGLRGSDGDNAHSAPAVPLRRCYFLRDRNQGPLTLGAPAGEVGLLTADVGLSTLTVPASSSRPGRTRTERNRCSIAHVVW